MKHFLVCAALAVASFTTVTLALESDANACGGCFAPQENPTVVNDHRMIFTISKDRSTLYDQIKYTGSPSSFAWVLPIAGTVDVGISSDLLFNVLDQQTQTRLLAPPQNCPPPPSGCFSSSSSGGLNSPSAGSDGKGGVQVLKEEVVGPYETKQLAIVKGDGTPDPEVLNQWLADNGYAIPEEVKPVIAQYVTEQFNFFVMKLAPGQGVQDMRPVRITTIGAGSQLPLRMVAAGTGPQVGISLWVVSEGRYEPQNFQSFIIDTKELVWDWTTSQSNYTELRAAKTAAGNGRIWEIESSTNVFKSTVESIVKQGTYDGSGPFPMTDEERAAQDYLPDTAKQLTAAQVRDADLATLFAGVVGQSARVTRLRADLAHAALDQDLAMTASQDQSELPTTRQITKEKNQPLCPVWDGCSSVGTAPRDEAIARSTPGSSASGSSCAVAPASGNTTVALSGLAIGAVTVTQALRRRRRRAG